MPDPRRKRRAPDDVLLDLEEAAERCGYRNKQSFRNLMWSADPPPMFKERKPPGRGQWRVWLSDLRAWDEARERRQPARDDLEAEDVAS